MLEDIFRFEGGKLYGLMVGLVAGSSNMLRLNEDKVDALETGPLAGLSEGSVVGPIEGGTNGLMERLSAGLNLEATTDGAGYLNE